ncbi:MAG: DUF2202 domain-containing protein [Bacteroidota bacterium]
MERLMIILMIALLIGCDNSEEAEIIEDSLSNQEIEDLQFLKEEEKLARDVYLFSYDLYGQNIFKNIANSEQMHMNSVSLIIGKYNIEDMSFEERGKFSNEVLQQLYNELINLSEKSLEDALIVGATIEDLDINDLNNFILNTNRVDIAEMYQKLNCGSRNHIRSYTINLTNLGVIYSPQYISVDEYNAIVSGFREKCN